MGKKSSISEHSKVSTFIEIESNAERKRNRIKTFLDSLKERRARAINDFHKTSVRSERKARNFFQIVKKKTTSVLFRLRSTLSNFLWPIAASFSYVRVRSSTFLVNILHIRRSVEFILLNC